MIGAKLFQRCGSQTRTRLVDIDRVAASVGEGVCKALIGLHAFTGCDTVSVFAGKGKVKALKLLKSEYYVRVAFNQLGQTWELPPDLFIDPEKFTCQLYSSGTNNVNKARYNLFCSKNGQVESHQLPPCQDCLHKHTLRANYQAGIWRRSLESNPAVPSPVGMGWKMEEATDMEELQFDWTEGRPAPEAVLELLACRCTRSCKLPNCVCLVNGLKCTDMCTLKDCDNQLVEEMEVINIADHVDDEEDDSY